MQSRVKAGRQTLQAGLLLCLLKAPLDFSPALLFFYNRPKQSPGYPDVRVNVTFMAIIFITIWCPAVPPYFVFLHMGRESCVPLQHCAVDPTSCCAWCSCPLCHGGFPALWLCIKPDLNVSSNRTFRGRFIKTVRTWESWTASGLMVQWLTVLTKKNVSYLS